MPTLRKLVWKPKVDSLANTCVKSRNAIKQLKKNDKYIRKILQLQCTTCNDPKKNVSHTCDIISEELVNLMIS
jgi:hypothetical protein